MNNSGNWKGVYGYDTKHSTYFTDYKSRKTETGVGVGTGQLTYKRCGVLKPNPEAQDPKQCSTGTCPWR